MAMTTKQKRNTILLIAAIVVGILCGVYYHSRATHVATPSGTSTVAGTTYSTHVSGYSLTLLKNGVEIQTLKLGEDAVAGMNLLAGDSADIQAFITKDDVNFDGHPDVAMLLGIGYGGVNLFYDYYVFDPATERFVKDPVLTEVGNPVFDHTQKTITADAKDAQDSFKTVYTWKGTGYVKGPTISDTTGTPLTEN
jgi:hypothetical protein